MSQLDLVLAAGIGGYHDDWSESETEEAASAAATEAHSEAHSEDALQELAALHAALPSPRLACPRFSRQVLSIFFFRILSVFLSKTGSIFSNMTRIQLQIGSIFSNILYIPAENR